MAPRCHKCFRFPSPRRDRIAPWRPCAVTTPLPGKPEPMKRTASSFLYMEKSVWQYRIENQFSPRQTWEGTSELKFLLPHSKPGLLNVPEALKRNVRFEFAGRMVIAPHFFSVNSKVAWARKPFLTSLQQLPCDRCWRPLCCQASTTVWEGKDMEYS